jgi:hypothetical protein
LVVEVRECTVIEEAEVPLEGAGEEVALSGIGGASKGV